MPLKLGSNLWPIIVREFKPPALFHPLCALDTQRRGLFYGTLFDFARLEEWSRLRIVNVPTNQLTACTTPCYLQEPELNSHHALCYCKAILTLRRPCATTLIDDVRRIINRCVLKNVYTSMLLNSEFWLVGYLFMVSTVTFCTFCLVRQNLCCYNFIYFFAKFSAKWSLCNV